ncbi:MAG: hypothetical protein ACXIVQ_08205 [Acidimicrobiales bacterium]
MVVAELEVFHSRPIAPTRRVALGESHLPLDPHPGFGAVLLGAVVASFASAIEDDMAAELKRLMTDVESGLRISQPRLRHRFQGDRVGLQRSVHRIVGRGDQVRLETEDRGAPVQQVLAAIYTVGTLDPGRRRPVMDVIRTGLQWRGDVGDRLLAHLSGRTVHGGRFDLDGDPVEWALAVFGLPVTVPAGPGDDDIGHLDRRMVQRRFRELLRDAHPDHGGRSDAAATRIAELAEARRILLA